MIDDNLHYSDSIDDSKLFNISKEIYSKTFINSSFIEKWQENEYRLLLYVMALRKLQNKTQKELADLIGTKQEVISRMESRKNSPSLANFCKIVNGLGYELRIEKKS